MAVEVSWRDGSDDGKAVPPPNMSRSQYDHLLTDLVHDEGVDFWVFGHSDSVGGRLGNETGYGKIIIYTPRG